MSAKKQLRCIFDGNHEYTGSITLKTGITGDSVPAYGKLTAQDRADLLDKKDINNYTVAEISKGIVTNPTKVRKAIRKGITNNFIVFYEKEIEEEGSDENNKGDVSNKQEGSDNENTGKIKSEATTDNNVNKNDPEDKEDEIKTKLMKNSRADLQEMVTLLLEKKELEVPEDIANCILFEKKHLSQIMIDKEVDQKDLDERRAALVPQENNEEESF